MRKTWICLLINSRFFARTTPLRNCAQRLWPGWPNGELRTRCQDAARDADEAAMQMCRGNLPQIGPHRCLVNHQWSFFSVWSITNLQDQRFWITHRYHCVGIMEYLQFGLRGAVHQAIATPMIGPPVAGTADWSLSGRTCVTCSMLLGADCGGCGSTWVDPFQPRSVWTARRTWPWSQSPRATSNDTKWSDNFLETHVQRWEKPWFSAESCFLGWSFSAL